MHLTDNQKVFKTGACLIQVYFNVFGFTEKFIHVCLIQVASIIEVATKTGFTVSAPKFIQFK